MHQVQVARQKGAQERAKAVPSGGGLAQRPRIAGDFDTLSKIQVPGSMHGDMFMHAPVQSGYMQVPCTCPEWLHAGPT